MTVSFRLLAQLAALAGVIAALFIVTAPSAFADRDTGWYVHECPESNSNGSWTIETYIRVIWHSGSNSRHIEEVTYIVTQGGSTVDSTSLGFWVLAIGGTWQNYAYQSDPSPTTTYVEDRIPTVNPDQGHYWLARGRDQYNNACDTQILN